MITGKLTVDTLPEVQSLARAGVKIGAIGWTCRVHSWSDVGYGFITPSRRYENFIRDTELPCVGMRRRNGAIEFKIRFHDKVEWATALGAWHLSFECKGER